MTRLVKSEWIRLRSLDESTYIEALQALGLIEAEDAATKSTDDIYTEDFMVFWRAYPNKKSKYAAFRAWRRVTSKRPLLADRILKAVEVHSVSQDWTKDNGKYIPHAATYLNQHRWEDVDQAQNADLYTDGIRVAN